MTQPQGTETLDQNQNENHDTEAGSTDVSGLSPEQMREELTRVRREAAQRRIENKTLKADADKWKTYEESQKTEMQKLQDALAERDKELSGYKLERMKLSIAKEVGLDADDAELLSGSDEGALRAHAERLKARLSPRQEQERRNPADLLAGTRGKPIGSGSETSIDDMIRASARRL